MRPVQVSCSKTRALMARNARLPTRENPITNAVVGEFLIRKENLPILEEILTNKAKTVGNLQNLAKKKPVMHELDIEEARSLLPAVKADVDAFLEVDGIEMPLVDRPDTFLGCLTRPGTFVPYLAVASSAGFAYGLHELGSIRYILGALAVATFYHFQNYMGEHSAGPYYERNKQSIILPCRVSSHTRVSMINVVAHEYAHHVQNTLLGPSYKGYESVLEGHAIGVEHHSTRAFAEREVDLASNEAMVLSVAHLKQVYLRICKETGQPPSKSLVGIETYTDEISWPHAPGEAFFSILERLRGPGVYREFINGALSV